MKEQEEEQSDDVLVVGVDEEDVELLEEEAPAQQTPGEEDSDGFKKPAPVSPAKAQEVQEVAKEEEKPKSPSPEPEPIVRAKVAHLKKPSGKGREKVKVTGGIMEILEGKRAGTAAHFQNSAVSLWGQPLTRADLNYYIRAGDEFMVEVGDSGGVAEVRKAMMGDHAKEPSQCQEFLKWLTSRGLDMNDFKKWKEDKLPNKFFFPLVTEVHEGEMVRVIKEKEKVVGGLVKMKSRVQKDSEDTLPPGEEDSSTDKQEEAEANGTELAVFLREDLYACEVFVGRADIRLLLRPGDTVRLMTRDLSGRPKAWYKNKLSAEEFEDTKYVATLAFVGDKRPRNATVSPAESPDLKEYLGRIGLSVEEMEQMISGFPPAGGLDPGLAPISVPINVNNVFNTPPPMVPANVVALGGSPAALLAHPGVSLASKTIKMQSAEDPRVDTLLVSDEDVDYAVFFAKIYTQALLKKMQTDMRSKLLKKFGTGLQKDVEGQQLQVKAAVKGIKNVQEPPRKVDLVQQSLALKAKEMALMTNASSGGNATPAIDKIAEKFLEVEAKIKMQELAKKQETGDSRAKKQQEAGKNKMKNMLQSFKATKSGGNTAKPDENKDNKDDKDLSPIELLRRYHMQGRSAKREGRLIRFGDSIAYPKSSKTNFMITRGAPGKTEYYTLETLHYFLASLHREHDVYLKRANEDGVPTVRRQDRNSLLSYLSGNRKHVINLVNKTHLELNPDQVQKEPVVSGFSSEYGTGGGVSDPTKRQLDPWTGNPVVPVKRKSRFDEPAAPTPVAAAAPQVQAPELLPWISPNARQLQQQPLQQLPLHQQQPPVWNSQLPPVVGVPQNYPQVNLPPPQQLPVALPPPQASFAGDQAAADLDRAIIQEKAKQLFDSYVSKGTAESLAPRDLPNPDAFSGGSRRTEERTSSSFYRSSSQERRSRSQDRGRDRDRVRDQDRDRERERDRDRDRTSYERRGDSRGREEVDPERSQYLQAASNTFELNRSSRTRTRSRSRSPSARHGVREWRDGSYGYEDPSRYRRSGSREDYGRSRSPAPRGTEYGGGGGPAEAQPPTRKESQIDRGGFDWGVLDRKSPVEQARPDRPSSPPSGWTPSSAQAPHRESYDPLQPTPSSPARAAAPATAPPPPPMSMGGYSSGRAGGAGSNPWISSSSSSSSSSSKPIEAPPPPVLRGFSSSFSFSDPPAAASGAGGGSGQGAGGDGMWQSSGFGSTLPTPSDRAAVNPMMTAPEQGGYPGMSGSSLQNRGGYHQGQAFSGF